MGNYSFKDNQIARSKIDRSFLTSTNNPMGDMGIVPSLNQDLQLPACEQAIEHLDLVAPVFSATLPFQCPGNANSETAGGGVSSRR